MLQLWLWIKQNQSSQIATLNSNEHLLLSFQCNFFLFGSKRAPAHTPRTHRGPSPRRGTRSPPELPGLAGAGLPRPPGPTPPSEGPSGPPRTGPWRGRAGGGCAQSCPPSPRPRLTVRPQLGERRDGGGPRLLHAGGAGARASLPDAARGDDGEGARRSGRRRRRHVVSGAAGSEPCRDGPCRGGLCLGQLCREGAVPWRAVPEWAVQGEAVPWGAVPEWTVPWGAVPGWAMPWGAVQGEAVPGGGRARKAVPAPCGEQLLAGRFTRTAVLCKLCCSAARPVRSSWMMNVSDAVCFSRCWKDC